MATSSGSVSSNAGPLDVASIVSKFMEVEKKAKIDPLVKKVEGINAAISAVGSLKSAMSTYEAAIKELKPASFSALKASLTNAGAGSKLTADAVSAEVNQDAQTKKLSQKLQSAAFAKDHVMKADSVMAIKIGKNPPTFITLKADATLAGLRATINASKAGVTASIVKDGANERLVLESNTAGTDGTMRITGMGSLAALAYDPSNPASAMSQIQAARDDTKAAAGNYAISVSQLAQTHKLSSAGIAAGTTFGDGILAIKTGSGSTTLITPSSNTLAGVRDAINASGAGVSASIINDGKHDRLIITAEKSGAANAIRITGTGAYSVFAFDPDQAASASNGASAQSMNETVKAQDAKFTIDGVAITSDSNTIKNVLSGVELTLSKVTTADDQLKLNIASDSSGMSTAATNFVNAYNALVKAVGELTRFAPGSKGKKGSSAPLANDSAVRNMMSQLRNAVMAPTGEGTGLTYLARVGISFQKDGTLALDNARLAELSKKDFDAVGQLFGGKQGVIPRMQKLMEQLLGTQGVMEKKKEGLQASLKMTEERYDEASRRLSTMGDQMKLKFDRLNIALESAEKRGQYMLKQLESTNGRR